MKELDNLRELAKYADFWEVMASLTVYSSFILSDTPDVKEEELHQLYDRKKLTNTEITLLFALGCQEYREGAKESQKALQQYEKEVLIGLAALQQSIIKDSFYREAIFYAGDGVYQHQFKEAIQKRYVNDEKWIKENKGFSLADAFHIFEALERLIKQKVEQWEESDSYLNIFIFTLEELSESVDIKAEKLLSVLQAFTAKQLAEGLNDFVDIDDFNHRNAFPIVKYNEKYICFQVYKLWESLYESPFFWFLKDAKYKEIANKNRGAFVEEYTADKLRYVFNKGQVYKNVELYDGKIRVGEIDVLVLHGHRALVIQAKSKALTIPARKGRLLNLADDFKKAIQDAYDQSLSCANYLLEGKVFLKTEGGQKVDLNEDIVDVFPICILSDYYPALRLQVRSFLIRKGRRKVRKPLICDVFFVDLLVSFLNNPVFFFDFLYKREQLQESLIANHELVILSVYLRNGLRFEEVTELMMLDDSFNAVIDKVLLSHSLKRSSQQGVPEGVLTVYQQSYLGELLSKISSINAYKELELGLFMLSLSEESYGDINRLLEQQILNCRSEAKVKNINIPVEQVGITITIHNGRVDYKALEEYREAQQYLNSAKTWFGVDYSYSEMFWRKVYYRDTFCTEEAIFKNRYVSQIQATSRKVALI